jgi:hypothetical protein
MLTPCFALIPFLIFLSLILPPHPWYSTRCLSYLGQSFHSMLPCSCFRESLVSILCSLTFPYLYPTRVRSVLSYLMTLSCSSWRSSLGSRFFRLYPCEIASHDRRLGVLSLVVCLNAWSCVNAWFGSLIECSVLWVDNHDDIGLV